jgi:hypothetical protein
LPAFTGADRDRLDDGSVFPFGEFDNQLAGLLIEEHQRGLLGLNHGGRFIKDCLQERVPIQDGVDALADAGETRQLLHLPPQILAEKRVLDGHGGLVAEGGDQLYRFRVEAGIEDRQESFHLLAEEEREEGQGADRLRETGVQDLVEVMCHHRGAVLDDLGDDSPIRLQLQQETVPLGGAERRPGPKEAGLPLPEHQTGSLDVKED